MAEVEVMEEAAKPDGVPQVVVPPPLHPVEVVNEARAPPVANKASILDFCPEENIYMQASFV